MAEHMWAGELTASKQWVSLNLNAAIMQSRYMILYAWKQSRLEHQGNSKGSAGQRRRSEFTRKLNHISAWRFQIQRPF